MSEPESPVTPDQKPTQRKWRRLLIGLEIGLVVSFLGGVGYARYYIFRKLSPQIEKQLSQSLNRPLNLGSVESFSLGGIRLGYSELPETEDDPDYVAIEAIAVNFNLLPLITQRKLKLNITLISPTVYVEQGTDKAWVDLEFEPPEPSEGGLQVEVGSIQVDQGKITLIARNSAGTLNPPVILDISAGKVTLSEDNQVTAVELDSELERGGSLQVRGDADLPDNQLELNVRARKLAASVVTDIVPLPLDVSSGVFDGAVKIELLEGALDNWRGEIVAKDLSAELSGLPQISDIQSRIKFRDQQLEFSKLTADMGDIALKGGLIIDLNDGYQGSIATDPFAISDIFTTFQTPQPEIELQGDVKAQVVFSGPLEAPELSLNAVNHNILTVDRVTVSQAQANASIIDSQIILDGFTIQPTLGGSIRGQGLVQLPTDEVENGSIVVDVQGRELPTSAFAQLYEVSSPVQLGFSQFNAVFKAPLDQADQFIVSGNAAATVAGGLVNATNFKVTKNSWQTPIEARGIRLAQLSDQTLPDGLQQSIINGDFVAAGSFGGEEKSSFEITGQARTTVAGGTAVARNINVTNQRWQSDVALQGLQTTQFASQIPPQFAGSYSGSFQAKGSMENVGLNSIDVTGSGRLAIAEGEIRTENIVVSQGAWYGQAVINGVNLAKVVPQLQQYTPSAPTQGQLKLSGTLENLSLEGIVAAGSAQTNISGGTIRAEAIALSDGQLTSDIIASNVALQPFSPLLSGVAEGNAAIVADLSQPDLKNIQAQGNLLLSEGAFMIQSPLRSRWAWTGEQLQIQEAIATGFKASGTLNIDSDRLGADPAGAITDMALNIDAQNLELAGIPLPEVAEAIPIAGQGSFSGTIQGTPKQPIVNGQIQLKDAAVAELAFEPLLTGNVQTNASGLNLTLQGEQDRILARLNAQLRPEQASLKAGEAELELVATYGRTPLTPDNVQISSQQLPVSLVYNIAKAQGLLDKYDLPLDDLQVSGKLSSNLAFDLQRNDASGTLAISQPTLAYIQGDRLSGDFYFSDQTLLLKEVQWRKNESIYQVDSTITLPNANHAKPKIQANAQVEKGRVEDVLVALQLFEYQDFQRLTSLSLPSYFGRSPYFGDSADLHQAKDQIPPDDPPLLPKISNPEAISITANQNKITLDCQSILADSPYNQSPLELELDQAEIDKILFSRGNPESSFQDKLNLLTCVEAKLASQDKEEAEQFPPAQLADLQGEFGGTIAVAYDGKDDLQADFDLLGGLQPVGNPNNNQFVGEPWQWGNITIPQIVARGALRNSILTLRPVSLYLPEGVMSFIGSVGGQSQTGQLILNKVPVALLEKFVELPEAVAVQGLVQANATLAGSPQDPQARGEMVMVDAEINNTPISSVKGDFTYQNARLDFIVTSELVAESEPLEVKGSLPYKLPFAEVAPKTNDLNLSFNLENEGLVLLNILSNQQLAWIDGEGKVDLTIDGEINPDTGRPIDLIAQGEAIIADATIKAASIPDAPVSNVQGKINFNFSTVTVQELTGDFSGGKIDISGQLPLVKVTSKAQTIDVLLDDLAFELPDLYRGGVDGNLIISGSALEPVIGGEVDLNDGRVILAAQSETSTPTSEPDFRLIQDEDSGLFFPAEGSFEGGEDRRKANPKPSTKSNLSANTQLDDLKITLGRNIEIIYQPILNFVAEGDLTLNGTLKDIKPQGTIELKRGQVNLFTTQFRLAKGYENTAVFSPSLGLDPELSVVLETSILDSPQAILQPTDPLTSEIRDNTAFSASRFGSVETIRIRAEVQGRASELSDSVTLSSSPPRSETEIIALLGGSIFDSFSGNGDSTLALANLAGSALLSNIQDFVGNALGVSELRLFPTVITDDENRSSTLGLGAEVTVDVSPSFSLSVLQILNSNESTQFGVRYRVNDRLFLRGSTDLGDDNRATFEYDLRF